MLTALLFSLSLQSAPVSLPRIETGALTMEAPDWAFLPLPSWLTPSTGADNLMFAVDIDPTAEVESEERAEELDIYETEMP